MNRIVSLANFRASTQLEQNNLTQEQLSLRIDEVAHQYLPAGAVLLLRQIIYLTNQGETELSYTYLSKRLGLARASVSKYFTMLEDLDFLKIRRSRVGLQNAVNQFEISFNGPLGDGMSKLKTPKKPRAERPVLVHSKSQNDEEGVVQNLNHLVQNVNGYKYKDNSKVIVPKGTRRSAPGFNSLEEAKQAVASRTNTKRAEKVEAQNKKGAVLTLRGVKATWSTAMLKHYPTVPAVAFTAKEFAIFKQKVAPLLVSANLSTLFEFIVENWGTLRATKFAWLRAKGNDVAIAPSLPELMRYWKVFAQAFADSRMVEAQAVKATTRSREQELEEELRKAKAEAATVKQEATKLKDRLQRSERIAYSPRTRVRQQPSRSLSQRIAELPEIGDDDLPEWE